MGYIKKSVKIFNIMFIINILNFSIFLMFITWEIFKDYNNLLVIIFLSIISLSFLFTMYIFGHKILKKIIKKFFYNK